MEMQNKNILFPMGQAHRRSPARSAFPENTCDFARGLSPRIFSEAWRMTPDAWPTKMPMGTSALQKLLSPSDPKCSSPCQGEVTSRASVGGVIFLFFCVLCLPVRCSHADRRLCARNI